MTDAMFDYYQSLEKNLENSKNPKQFGTSLLLSSIPGGVLTGIPMAGTNIASSTNEAHAADAFVDALCNPCQIAGISSGLGIEGISKSSADNKSDRKLGQERSELTSQSAIDTKARLMKNMNKSKNNEITKA